MGFFPFLTLILITLKLLGLIAISWFLVWLPLFMPFIFLGLIALLCTFLGADVFIPDTRTGKRNYFNLRKKKK